MQARYYIPEKLTGLVNAIWEQRAVGPRQWTFLPTGCVELIFRLGPALESIEGKSLNDEVNPTRNVAFLSGLHTRPFEVRFTRFHFIGIQMQPIAVNALFGIPCYEVRDWALDGNMLLRDLEEPEIEERLRGEEDFRQKARWLEDFMVNRLGDADDLTFAGKLMEVVDSVIFRRITGEDVSIEDLTGYSRTHTYRLFKKWFGVSPSRCVQLYRYVRALNQIHMENGVGRLTDVAYGQGYYDQSHFIHTFKEFAGMTPGEYRESKSEIPFQLSR